MKENLKTILIIASVALNAVFAATYVVYKLPPLAGGQPATSRGPLFLQLDLTPDQLAEFKAERDRFHGELQELGQETKQKQLELIDLLVDTTPDQQAVKKKQEEIQHVQRTVQDRVIAHFLHESGLLTPEQRTRFFQLIKGRIGTSVQTCPPWAKPFEKGQAGAN